MRRLWGNTEVAGQDSGVTWWDDVTKVVARKHFILAGGDTVPIFYTAPIFNP